MKKELKHRIIDIIYSKNMSERKIYLCKKLLNQYISINNGPDLFYNLYYAKLYIIENDLRNAQRYLEYAKNINNTNASIYYTQFKIDIRNRKYNEAKENLNLYEKMLNEQNKPVDLSIYYYLLSILTKDNKINISSSNFINCVKISDDTLLKLWNEFIEMINNEDFDEAEIQLKEIQKYIDESKTKFKLDFTEILLMISYINKQNNNMYIPKLIVKINNYIDEGNIKQATKFFDLLKSSINAKRYKDEVELLEKKLNEKTIQNEIKNNEYLNEYRRQCLEYGKLCQYYKDYDNAINYFEAGLYVTKDPIFLYRLGKIYMYRGFYRRSEYYFNEYIKNGFDKCYKCYMFLSKMRCIYTYNERRNYYYMHRQMLYLISKINGNLDIYKEQKTENFESTLFDNYEEETKFDYDEIINNFENYDQNKKVLSLKKLYEHGYANVADRLIKQYKSTIPQKEIEKLYSNKKLYLKKSR